MAEPYRCFVCGADLTPTPEQLEALRRFGNPLRRQPCLLTRDGQHRVDVAQIERKRQEAAYGGGAWHEPDRALQVQRLSAEKLARSAAKREHEAGHR